MQLLSVPLRLQELLLVEEHLQLRVVRSRAFRYLPSQCLVRGSELGVLSSARRLGRLTKVLLPVGRRRGKGGPDSHVCKAYMEPLSGTMRMEMYSRYGKATAAMVHLPAFHPVLSTKQKPVRVQMDAARLAALVETATLRNQSTSPSRSTLPIRPSPAFSTVSRQQRADNQKPSYVDAPAPTHYSPKADLTHPRSVAGCRMRMVPTCPRGQVVTLGSCWSEGKLMCRFARKTATGEPLATRPATQKTISLREFQRTAVQSDLSPVPSSLYLRPNLSFNKQTPRKYHFNPNSQAEESLSSAEISTSRHVASPYFGKMQGRSWPG